jgi:hypothetical protein
VNEIRTDGLTLFGADCGAEHEFHKVVTSTSVLRSSFIYAPQPHKLALEKFEQKGVCAKNKLSGSIER